MQTIFIFEVEILKAGTSEIFKTIHLIGYNLFQVSHIAMHIVYDEDGEFKNELLEVGSIRKLPEVKRIYNPEFVIEMLELEDEEDYDGSNPLEIGKKLPDEAVMEFSCRCHEKLRVPQGYWPFVTCPNCENKILRREVKNVGGLFFYEKLDDNKK